MSATPSKYISRAGEGKQGYCKICSFQYVGQFNKNLAAGWTTTQLINWTRENYDFTVTRATIYNHRDNHAKRAEDRLVTAVQKQQSNTRAMMPRVSSNEQFLEAVRDMGYQRAIANPDEVTLDHALKATQILTQKKSGAGDILIVLARAMTGGGLPEPEVVEGDFSEVSAEQ